MILKEYDDVSNRSEFMQGFSEFGKSNKFTSLNLLLLILNN